MKTNILKAVRLHPAEFRFGKWKAGYIHIGTPAREIVKICRAMIKNPQQRFNNGARMARKALYAGALLAIREERKLCATFKL